MNFKSALAWACKRYMPFCLSYNYKSIIFGSDEDIIIENAANQGLNGWILDYNNALVGGFTGLELEVLRLMLKALLEAGRP